MTKWFRRQCDYCGKQYRGRGKSCCSTECIHKLQVGNKNPNYRGGHLNTCLVCNKEFWVIPSTQYKVCGPSCSNKLRWKRDRALLLEQTRKGMKKHSGRRVSLFQKKVYELFKNYYPGRKIALEYPITCGAHLFFIDIAFPNIKLAIECDGEYWHNALKDQWRDSMLKKEGWFVWRIKQDRDKWRQLTGIKMMSETLKTEASYSKTPQPLPQQS